MADMPRRRRRVDRRQTHSAGAAPWSGGFVALLGFVGLLGLVVATLAWVVPTVEGDLEASLLTDLRAAGVDTSGLVVDFDYRSATITGTADRSRDSLTALTAGLAGRGGIRSIEVGSIETDSIETDSIDTDSIETDSIEVGSIETVEPRPPGTTIPEVAVPPVAAAEVEVVVEQGTLTLRGTVTAAEEAALLDAAAVTGRTVYNELGIGATVPTSPRLGPFHDAIRQLPDDQTGSLRLGPDGVEAQLSRLVAQQAQLVLDALEAAGPIEFDTASSELSPAVVAALQDVAAVLVDNPDVKVTATGHADSRGSSSFNQTLSEARADAVIEQLLESGVERHRLASFGRGESDPIGDNDTPIGQQRNRRVALTVAEGG